MITDVFAGGATFTSGDNGNNILDVGETWIYTADYTVTQADIDAGTPLVNVAIVDTDQTGPVQDDATTIINQTSSLTITKSVDQTEISIPVNLTYSIVIVNTGNTSLTGVVLTDALTGGANLTGGDNNGNGILDVGETWTYSSTYDVTQADIDAGTTLVNLAVIDTDQTDPQQDDATTTITQTTAWSMTKVAGSANFDAAGDILNYTITINNDGNISIGNIVLTDPGADTGSITFAGGDTDSDNRLDPDEKWTYTATHTATLADIDAGHYSNTATATGTTIASGTVTVTATADVIGIQNPELTLVKSADRAEYTAPGETINYTLTVTNTGNVTITGITVSDPIVTVTCPGAPYTLIPGASATCTATHTVTIADILAGSIINTAICSRHFALNSCC